MCRKRYKGIQRGQGGEKGGGVLVAATNWWTPSSEAGSKATSSVVYSVSAEGKLLKSVSMDIQNMPQRDYVAILSYFGSKARIHSYFTSSSHPRTSTGVCGRVEFR